ncbi:MAG: aldo/keto reductase, partial [Chitinivibrionales bacterium]|nr:aldo/keto reductase [Chitinivibrionales bacterium]
VGGQMRAMADLVNAGKIRAVGVSNFSAGKMREAHAALAKHGIRLASNQVRYSLLDRRMEVNGVLSAAEELRMTVIAYSPLAQGLLTGKYHDNPEAIRAKPGYRKFMGAFSAKGLRRSRPVIDALRNIAAVHKVHPAQVALNWAVSRNGERVVAIPGATKQKHARLNARAAAFTLTPQEIELLDGLSAPFRYKPL